MGDKAIRDGVISNLRACLLSAKGGVSFSELNSDYRKIVGESIPFRKLGYPSLDEFLLSVDGLAITRKGGDWNVAAKPTEDSIHLSRLIAKQKSAPKKRSRGLTARNRRPISSPWKRPVDFQTTRPLYQSGRDAHASHRPSQSSRSSNTVPLMQVPQRKPIPSLFDKPPRYMLPNSGSPQSSPSKRLSDRMAQTSQSSNNQTPVVAYKNKACFQAAPTERVAPQTSTPLPSLLSLTPRPGQFAESSNARNSDASQSSKPLKPLSERLKVKTQPAPKSPTILSPLSPIQLINSAPNVSRRQTTTSPVRNEVQNESFVASQHHDPCKQLELLARKLNLPEPVYKVAPYNIKRQQMYGCHVKVGPNSYTSYPQDTATPDEAKKVAATKAVKEILLKEGPLHGLSETTNKNSVKERVKAIVAQHENGVFMNQIPTYYKELYRENLPEEWEKIIEECSEIFKEKGADDSTILCPYVHRAEVANDSDRVVDSLSPRLEKIQLSPIGPPVPGIIKPPSEPYWDVHITSVLSTADIWARLIGEEYSEQFDVMLNEMETYYKKSATAPGTGGIQRGSYYAVQEQDTWHRVQCLDFDLRSGKADVFFIDHGDEDTFHYSKLFPLEKRFCGVPAQAVNLSLADLEEFSDCYEVIEYLEKLFLAKTLVAQVISRESLDEEEWVASVVLFDTREPMDINLNEVLLKKISENILVPKLKQEGQVSEVYVSHVTETGDVYLHVKSESMRHLINLMNKLIQSGLTKEDVQRSEPKSISTDKVYLARCFEDGNWYRGVVTSVEPNNKIKVFLIDMGKTIVIDKKSHLLVLDQLSEVLTKYPHQALKVRLHDIPESMFNSEMIAKLSMLAPSSDQLLVRVVTPGSRSNPPVVELFKRVGAENLLVSINHTLAIDPEIIGSNGDGNNNTRPRKRLERTVSRHGATGDGEMIARNLKPPKIPGFGKYFDVHITMAANPGNFTVQPYDDRVYLEAMMVQLQEVCVNYTGPSPSFESIKEGSLYAAKHFDSHYYRVCISKIIGDQMVTVYFCDFGDVSVLTLDKLQPLGRQFLELPYQAIRARLVGVQPQNMDWSVEDCLRFQELVVERNFVSIVVDSGPDRLSPGDTVLGLKLIDVSEETDIHLDKLLVAEGRATAIEV